MISLRQLGSADISGCESVLRSLPEWFGIESAIVEYGRDLSSLDGLVALDGERLVGFVGLKRYGEESVEINVIAVAPDRRDSGIGTMLLRRVEESLPDRVRLIHMKTLASSHPDPHYGATRSFWKAKGFIAMDAHQLWGSENPCLVMVKHRPSGNRR